jgi:hypothetical protein
VPSPFLYFVDDRLSLAELSAARLDGDVVELGEAYIPADAVETAALRAGSLTTVLGANLAATHLSAAWIHGAMLHPPVRHTVQRAVSRRITSHIGRHLVYRDLAVDPDDLLTCGGVWVTTPVRTLADLARVPDDAHSYAARALAEHHPAIVLGAIAWLESRRKLPHRHAALAFLRGLAAIDYDDVTR